MLKFEKIAEIKYIFKNCDDSRVKERDSEMAQVKTDMEELKTERV